MQLGLAVIVLVAVHVDVSFGKPDGAPSSACQSMTPGLSAHGTEETGANPYNVTLPSGVKTYTPGATIKVNVTGTFKGILLQARKTDGSTTPFGTWETTVANTKTTECTDEDDAITHSSSTAKTNAEFTWTAPSTDVGTLKFVATVVKEQSEWWKNTMSAEITYEAGVTTTTTTPGAGVKEVASAIVLAAAFTLQYVL